MDATSEITPPVSAIRLDWRCPEFRRTSAAALDPLGGVDDLIVAGSCDISCRNVLDWRHGALPTGSATGAAVDPGRVIDERFAELADRAYHRVPTHRELAGRRDDRLAVRAAPPHRPDLGPNGQRRP